MRPRVVTVMPRSDYQYGKRRLREIGSNERHESVMPWSSTTGTPDGFPRSTNDGVTPPGNCGDADGAAAGRRRSSTTIREDVSVRSARFQARSKRTRTLDAGRAREAEAVYRADLAHPPV